MLKWLYLCNGCGVEAPVPALDLPRGWMHRAIVDRAQPDAHGNGGGSLERNEHYCPACKVHVLQGVGSLPGEQRAGAGGVVGRPGSGARSALRSPPKVLEASSAPPRAGRDRVVSSRPIGVVSEDVSDQAKRLRPHESRSGAKGYSETRVTV
jgi:hypothetical protein